MEDVNCARGLLSEAPAVKALIYVVDDDADVLSSARFLLETEGFDVRTFDDSAALLNFSARATADCLIIDYKIPKIDGLELVRMLRRLDIQTPVVFITGYLDEAFLARVALAAVSRVLLKPHIEENLAAYVRAAILDQQMAESRRQLRDSP